MAYDNFCLEKVTICPGWGDLPPHRGAILIVGLSSAIGTYPSGHATDEIRVSTSGAAESFRFDRSPIPEKVYINLNSRKTRGETMKKSESDDESEIKGTLEDTKRVVANNAKWVLRELDALKAQIKALQGEIEAMQKGDNTGFRHENDGGWFD